MITHRSCGARRASRTGLVARALEIAAIAAAGGAVGGGVGGCSRHGAALDAASAAAAHRSDGDGDAANLTSFVDPFIGTATFDGEPDNRFNAGNVFPGAAYPFGMVQLSPDNTTAAGGYRYVSPAIDGFSLTHFSGRGVSCWQDIGILPIASEITRSPGADWSSFASPFQHAHEDAAPGRYHVRLDASGIDVELTATARTGMARFVFPAGSPATVLVNAGHSAQGNSGPGTAIVVSAPNRLAGSAESGDCGGTFRYRLFFVAEFNRPSARSGTWDKDSLQPGGTNASGAETGAFLTFDATAGRLLTVRIGVSFVSVEAAARNLSAENATWDFDAVAARATRAWNARLHSIEIGGGTADERAIFYTALYHTMLHPNLFSDIDGGYLGFDGRVHQAPGGRAHYENFAGWDNYRSEMPLLSIIAPVEVGDMMSSLVDMAEEDPGGGLPRWQQAAGNSGGMVGDSQDVVLASAYAFGVRGFDAAAALRAMDRGASIVEATSGGHRVREGLAAYLAKGYVPYSASSTGRASASITLEYATDDFAIAALAGALGDEEMRERYLARSGNWKNLWNVAGGGEGRLAPRLVDGAFLPDISRDSSAGFVEGTAEQYVWMVPFDPRGLVAAMGGAARAVARLDEHFRALNDGLDGSHFFFGNEPGENTPWLYAFAGDPHRTQAVVRRILREMFRKAPSGLAGNDDGGALSSWAVFASLGLYPSIPGVGGFVIASPLFPEATVHLARGRSLRVLAPAAAADTPFVRALQLDGRPYDRAWIPWDRVASGAVLSFDLSRAPS